MNYIMYQFKRRKKKMAVDISFEKKNLVLKNDLVKYRINNLDVGALPEITIACTFYQNRGGF